MFLETNEAVFVTYCDRPTLTVNCFLITYKNKIVRGYLDVLIYTYQNDGKNMKDSFIISTTIQTFTKNMKIITD